MTHLYLLLAPFFLVEGDSLNLMHFVSHKFQDVHKK